MYILVSNHNPLFCKCKLLLLQNKQACKVLYSLLHGYGIIKYNMIFLIWKKIIISVPKKTKNKVAVVAVKRPPAV